MTDRLMDAKQIVLGVSGGIAAYKAAHLASRLTQAGALVDVILTEAATRFVTPLTFQAITQRLVYTDMFESGPALEGQAPGALSIPHVALAQNADLLLVAPATANTLASLAHGLADNLLTSTALACQAPLLLAPAMESKMWAHDATQTNVETLVRRGATLAGPGIGHLASGASGEGRMAEPDDILQMVRIVLAQNEDLAGKRVVVSAGGTREAIDPVRFIGNHSSGKMGYALAIAARDRGAQVTLVTAPTVLPDPLGIRVVEVSSAFDMRDCIIEVADGVDVLVMAAAVADFQPTTTFTHKIKKSDESLTLKLERTPDILCEVADLRPQGRGPKITVGFAAETEDLLDNARQKLRHKQLDLIAANDLIAPDAGFAVDTNRVTLLWPNGMTEPLPLMPKTELAHVIWDHVSQLMNR